LRKAGATVKLTNLPFQVLAHLARNAGTLISREDLHRLAWGGDTFVDFDRNLNVAIAQVRSALNDDAESPRFIQTVPRRGYRFVAPVERVTQAEAATADLRRSKAGVLAAGILLTIAVAAALLMGRIRPDAPRGQQRSLIALLPFQGMNGADEALLDSLTDELITQLGSLDPGRLGVIARSSVMRYKGRQSAIDQVARELKVDYVLEGTARRQGSLVRFTVRLISARDQSQIWSTAFNHDAASGFLAEEEIAARIAAGITAAAFPGAPPRAAPLRAHNPDAWAEYRQGRRLQHQGERDALARAVQRFDRALLLEPQFSEAAAASAESYVSLARMGAKPIEAFPKAAEAARSALSLDSASGEAHNALANTLFWYDWNWREAEKHFRQAISINPSHAAAHHDYAWLQVATHRTEEGLISLQRALELDPLSRRVNIDAGWLLLQARRYREAAEQARHALEIEPDLREAVFCLSRALVFQQRYDEARDELLKVLEDPALKSEVASLDPKAATERLYRLWANRSPAGWEASRLLAWLGEKDKALEALELAIEKRSAIAPLLGTDPSFDGIAADARFQELVRKVGLPSRRPR
jgi:TolB-like protein/DNA-binding winged helix-turn-helix (wHTH) protein